MQTPLAPPQLTRATTPRQTAQTASDNGQPGPGIRGHCVANCFCFFVFGTQQPITRTRRSAPPAVYKYLSHTHTHTHHNKVAPDGRLVAPLALLAAQHSEHFHSERPVCCVHSAAAARDHSNERHRAADRTRICITACGVHTIGGGEVGGLGGRGAAAATQTARAQIVHTQSLTRCRASLASTASEHTHTHRHTRRRARETRDNVPTERTPFDTDTPDKHFPRT